GSDIAVVVVIHLTSRLFERVRAVVGEAVCLDEAYEVGIGARIRLNGLPEVGSLCVKVVHAIAKLAQVGAAFEVVVLMKLSDGDVPVGVADFDAAEAAEFLRSAVVQALGIGVGIGVRIAEAVADARLGNDGGKKWK